MIDAVDGAHCSSPIGRRVDREFDGFIVNLEIKLGLLCWA